MLILRDPAAAVRVPDAEVRVLVEQRFAMLSADEPYDPDVLGYFIVLEDCDGLGDLDAQLGFSILSNRFDGTHFGEANYTPSFEILEEHASCYEIVFVISDDGYGVEIFIPKACQIDRDLLSMCQRYAVPAQEPTRP